MFSRRDGMGRMGQNVSLARGPKLPLLARLNVMPFSNAQKAALDARAQLVDTTPAYVNPNLSFFNPPADNSPFTITPQPAPSYPLPGTGPIAVISYTVAAGLFSVIRELAIVHVGGNPPDFTGIVIWRVLKNGAGIRGLNNLNAQYGTFAAPKSLVIVGVENDIFSVTVECPSFLPDGVTPNPGMPIGAQTAASFDGWTYPLAQSIATGS
jgi:hypothetical protein